MSQLSPSTIEGLKRNKLGFRWLPNDVQEWMKDNWRELVVTNHNGWVPKAACVFADGRVYRVDKNYQLPKPMKYWIRFTEDKHGYLLDESPTPIDNRFLEISRAHFDYIEKRPDIGWELRIPENGDEYLALSDRTVRQAIGPYRQGIEHYRWCRKPEPKVQEYPIEKLGLKYFVRIKPGFSLYLTPAIVGLKEIKYAFPSGTVYGWSLELPPFVRGSTPLTPVAVRIMK